MCLRAVLLQVLRSHTSLALADAQSITFLRAIQKGNAPSLVAGLAHDTMQLYQTAAQSFSQASAGRQGSKASKYAEWKALVAQAYAFAFAGKLTAALLAQRKLWRFVLRMV